MAEPVHIVIIDDNVGSVEMLSAALRQTGVSIHTASDPAEGLEIVRRVRPRLVVTDLVMPGLSGLDVLEQVMSFDPSIDVLLMTAHYTTETAVEAIRRGAADYLQKPVKIATLRTRVAELIASAELRRKARSSENADSHTYEFEGFIAKSSIMWEVLGMLQRIAPHYRSVLIQGPTGVGKDLVARALHRRSGVKGKFVVLNCSAVVETLFESELFGHVKGAFTGADRDKVGTFRSGGRRHSVSGRSRRYAPFHASEVAARGAESGGSARRIASFSQGECPHHCGHPSRSSGGQNRRHISRGSLLPACDGRVECPFAEGTSGGYPAAWLGIFCGRLLPNMGSKSKV